MNAADLQALRGELRRDEPMAQHNSWRVGGTAARFFRPADVDDLRAFLAMTPDDEPLYWLGLGSNVLIRDGGLDGTVIATHAALGWLERRDARTVYAGAGTACAKLARRLVRWQLAGGHFFAGIPGTLGGALAMNAGAFGGETWQHVTAVEMVDRSGELHRLGPEAFRVGYRSVEPRQPQHGEMWFVAADLSFEADTAGDAAERLQRVRRERSEMQPVGVRSCGSVFRNPPGDHAARLIDEAGLKGLRQGGAEVSRKHANFIINRGDASAADIEALIETVQETVHERFGVALEREVRILGRAGQ